MVSADISMIRRGDARLMAAGNAPPEVQSPSRRLHVLVASELYAQMYPSPANHATKISTNHVRKPAERSKKRSKTVYRVGHVLNVSRYCAQ